jgi:Flp pilus assembly protein TadG
LGSRDVTVRKTAVLVPPILARFWRDQGGVVAVAVAILLPVLIGFAGLGIEVGMWFWIQRQNQSAADAAAISAALEYAAQIERGVATDSAAATAAATTAANCNLFSTSSSSSNAVCPLPSSASNTITLYPCYGFTVGSSCNTLSSNGTLNAVQIALTQPLNTTFANLVTAIWGPSLNTVNVTTTAIAAFPAAGTACYLALDPTAADTFLVDNNGMLPNANCWVASNSSSASALNCNSNCTIAGPTTVVGGDAVSNNGHLDGSPNRTYVSAIADPYASVSVTGFPAPGTGCTPPFTPATPVTSGSIPPGHYCGGIQINGTTVTMSSSGVYYIDQAFNIDNGSLNAIPPGGVTIIINGGYPVGIGPNSTLKINAQSTGPFAGIAIFGPRNSSPGVIQEFAANSRNNIQGAIYFPSQTIQFDPNSQLTSACTQIIAQQIHIENSANVSANCDGTGVASIPIFKVYLANYET